MKELEISIVENICAHEVIIEVYDQGVSVPKLAEQYNYFSGYKRYTDLLNWYRELNDDDVKDFYSFFAKLNQNNLLLRISEKINNFIIAHNGERDEVQEFINDINKPEYRTSDDNVFFGIDCKDWEGMKKVSTLKYHQNWKEISLKQKDVRDFNADNKFFIIHN